MWTALFLSSLFCLAQGFHYEVTISTGDVECGGTDSDVYLTLIGQHGQSKKFYLDNSGNDFETEDVDTYKIDTDKLYSPLVAIEIHKDDSGGGPAWFLKDVKVYCTFTGTTQMFRFNSWLQDAGPYSLDVRLTPSTGLEGKGQGSRPNPVHHHLFDISEAYKGNRYFLYKNNENNYNKAQSICTGIGGHLAEIKDDAEFNFVAAFLKPFRKEGEMEVFVGINDRDAEGRYVYATSGEDAKYLKWGGATNEPEGGRDRNCVALWSSNSFLMYDVECERSTKKVRPLCKVPLGNKGKAQGHGNKGSTTVSKYTVTVRTGAVECGGTDADVYLTLIGQHGHSQQIELNSPRDDFEQGDVDIFHIETHELYSPLVAIELSKDDSGRKPAWFLRDVEVYSPETGISQKFPFNNWLQDAAPYSEKVRLEYKGQ